MLVLSCELEAASCKLLIMYKITGIKNKDKQGKRVNIFVDGRLGLTLNAETAILEKLKIDSELDSARINKLTEDDQFRRCMDTAVRFLEYRPRSESELRDRLQRRGFIVDNIDSTINKLKEQGLVDDSSFARFWTENRESFSPRSQYFTRRELAQKGVAPEIAEEAVSSIDDTESAYRTALQRASRIRAVDYRDFRNRLGGYLRRRGFGYETINKTVEKIWQEQAGVKTSPSENSKRGS